MRISDWSSDVCSSDLSRVSNAEVWDGVASRWLPLDPARTYKLFVLNFNATGGDGYATLAGVPAERRQDIGVLDADVLQTYIDMQATNAAGLDRKSVV